MTDPDRNHEIAENERIKLDDDDPNSTTVHLDLDHDDSKTHFIKSNANGGAAGDHPADEYKTAIIDPTASSDGEVSFSGLGKEEVLKYANDPFWVRLRWVLFILFWVGWLAMLVIAIVIIVLAPRCPPRPDLKWYQTKAVYQVYAKSFKDSNGDGTGDFEGLQSKMSYVTKDLGIEAIWLSSIFKTDGTILGIIDHKELDETFGVTLDEFKNWLKKMRKEGKNVILDLIPNQTSKKHAWFTNKDGLYKDYYIWANGTGVPNNWGDKNGGWTFDNDTKAWYFHHFSLDYPDLNLNNPKVRDEFKDIMKFWMEAGVSGFHIQDLEYLVENPDVSQNDDSDKSMTKNTKGTLEFLDELREIANAYSDKPGREKLLSGTVMDATLNQTLEYWGDENKTRLHIVAPLMKNLDYTCNAQCVMSWVERSLTDSTQPWLGLQLGNLNIERIATRLDDGSNEYLQRLMIAHALQLLLPGTPFVYYGDEFGQRDSDQQIGNLVENYRAPMQWSTQVNAGFTSPGVEPWHKIGATYLIDNLEVNQAQHSGLTPFEAFHDLLKLRGRESFQWGKTQNCNPKEDLFVFTRKATRFPFFLTLINMSNKKMHVSPHDLECVAIKETGTIKFHTDVDKNGGTLNLKAYALQLQPWEILVVEFPADEE